MRVQNRRLNLTPRQRECLRWAGAGKSSADIGLILGLSSRTVDDHIAEACRRLGVRTRVQAIVILTRDELRGGRAADRG